ncbi:PD-(D/E)XK nuclease family protein [Bacillus sp. EB01]|uniref:PD-(D/E)XK nuclease family protein n=1 Tax=Bacillus sp. EB01 TaxID=1347086 RepID=UPI0005C45693|nr:PD-(D/E)XK nuclease family protein [Bacillus sp. EB01]
MRPFFTRLYDLVRNSERHRIEDYLTEIISPILEEKGKLLSFLCEMAGLDFPSVSNVEVYTQKTYSKLGHHDMDSRPDLVITFNVGKQQHLLFLENKVDSREGSGQLQRYADQLMWHKQQGYFPHLMYITKLYEQKSDISIMGLNLENCFYQKRWYEVYKWLSQFGTDMYCKQVLTYMEELNLNKSRKFSLIDVYAIQNAQRLQTMLDEVLDGKVTGKFTEAFGKPKQWSHRTTQLRNNNLYVIINDQSDWKFVGCGFDFDYGEEYPEVTVFIEVQANCKHKKETLEAIKHFCENNEDWKYQAPSDNNATAFGYTTKSIVEFLSEEDHIESIQNYLVGKLEELKELKEANPELKWVVRG